MPFIQTPPFTLATYAKGNPHAQKLALVLPGRTDSKDYAHMTAHVDFLATKGFHALSFDPPGTWESHGDISLYNTTNYLKAVDEVIAYFGNRSTLVMGHSFGAGIATLAAMRNPSIYAFISVFSALRADGLWESMDAPLWKQKGYYLSKRDVPPGGGPKIKEFKIPYSFYEDRLQYRVGEDLAKSSKAKLFFLGKRDPLIKPEVIQQLYERAGEPKELYQLGSDHDYRYHPALINEVNQIVGDFLEKYHL